MVKIIGKTDGGYLLSATEDEVAKIAGFTYGSEGAFLEMARSLGATNNRGDLKIGADIPIRHHHEYIRRVCDREATAKVGAKALRELADMIDGGVPSAIIPPEPETCR